MRFITNLLIVCTHNAYINMQCIDDSQQNQCKYSTYVIKYWETNNFQIDIPGKLENIPT